MTHTTTIDERVDSIAAQLLEGNRQSELGQTFRVFVLSAAVHMDHNSHIAYEYLHFDETEGKGFDECIDWPEAAKTRKTFDPAFRGDTLKFWAEHVRPYVEADQDFLIQLQVVEDMEHTDACGWTEEKDDCQGDHAWPAWALMIAEAK
jgi:hypothetical protein